MLYPNEFKIWEFSKEAAQIFVPEQVAVAEWQGMREDRKFATKLAQLKTNF